MHQTSRHVLCLLYMLESDTAFPKAPAPFVTCAVRESCTFCTFRPCHNHAPDITIPPPLALLTGSRTPHALLASINGSIWPWQLQRGDDIWTSNPSAPYLAKERSVGTGQIHLWLPITDGLLMDYRYVKYMWFSCNVSLDTSREILMPDSGGFLTSLRRPDR
ncbi:uncharacterized protein EDB91DRAFT_846263 [Suillus paluster]|uniref:uncharacterized protein n=1 Tax=Suillus paluster TaxID=48578 RepID=UPI001B886FD6|nr:uncharacterized protein EDB91DRAFT_846263 [Suillus paluster]KAG1728713.1 hypothetical protein EDB91DRAFT_846263 [Suillus paluster]